MPLSFHASKLGRNLKPNADFRLDTVLKILSLNTPPAKKVGKTIHPSIGMPWSGSGPPAAPTATDDRATAAPSSARTSTGEAGPKKARQSAVRQSVFFKSARVIKCAPILFQLFKSSTNMM